MRHSFPSNFEPTSATVRPRSAAAWPWLPGRAILIYIKMSRRDSISLRWERRCPLISTSNFFYSSVTMPKNGLIVQRCSYSDCCPSNFSKDVFLKARVWHFFIRAVHMSTQTKAEVDVLMQRVRATGSKPWVASGDARFLVAPYACLGASQPRLPPSLHR